MSGHMCACFKGEFATLLVKQNEQPSPPSTNNESKLRGKEVGENYPQRHKSTNTRPTQIVFPSIVIPGETNTPCMEPTVSCNVSPTQEEDGVSGYESGSKRGIPPLWNLKFNKKKRSKLTRYVPTPAPTLVQELIYELQHASRLQMEQYGSIDQESCNSVDIYGESKYDETFIYERCNLIYPNEVGVGAMLYSPSVSLQMSNDCKLGETKTCTQGVLDDDDCASSCILFDVPVHDSSDDNY